MHVQAYGCVLQQIPVRCGSLWAVVTAKLRSSSLGLTRIMYKKFVVVKLWGIITFALSAQNKFVIGDYKYMFYFHLTKQILFKFGNGSPHQK